jgi:hypothetical protein
MDIDEIPQKYILRRWKKDLIPPGMRTRRTRYGELSEDSERMANEMHFMIDICVDILGKDEEKLSDLAEKVRALKDEIEAAHSSSKPKKNDEVIEQFLGVEKPTTNEVQNPPLLSYKGCGRDSRLKPLKEKLVQEYLKPKRKCGKCGEMTRTHDTRNCEKKKAEKAKSKEIAAHI